MAELFGTAAGARAARREVISMGAEYEESLRYPISILYKAPKAVAGRDDLKELWEARREVEMDGVEAIALSIDAIAMSLGAADSQFNRALEELDIARNNGADVPEGAN